jgi:hypothetical protein
LGWRLGRFAKDSDEENALPPNPHFSPAGPERKEKNLSSFAYAQDDTEWRPFVNNRNLLARNAG